MTSNNDSLDLETVVRRFADAEEALSKVKTHLQSLGSMRESEEKNAESLLDAANQISEFVNVASAAMDELKSAEQKVVDILKSASDILDGTELKSISDKTERITQSVKNIEDKQTATESKLVNFAKQIESLANVMQSLQEQTESSTTQLLTKLDEVQDDVKKPTIVKRLF